MPLFIRHFMCFCLNKNGHLATEAKNKGTGSERHLVNKQVLSH